MAIARTLLPDFFKTRLAMLEDIIRDIYDQYPLGMAACFNERDKSGGGSFFKTSGYSGLGLYAQVAEGEDITTDDPVQGYDKTWTFTKHGLGYVLTSEMQDDDLDSIAADFTRHLGISEQQSVETQAFNHFNRAFDTDYTGPDGQVLCGTAHPLAKAGGTASNTLSTAADLSTTSLEQAYIDMGDWVDEAGRHIYIPARKLLIPTELDWTSQRILRSDQLPMSANNDINPARNFVEPQVSIYLTDPDAWFLLSDKSQHKMIWAWKQRDRLEDQYNAKAQKLEIFRTYRAISGWADWRGVYGSPGA